jgi:hypothetical protein
MIFFRILICLTLAIGWCVFNASTFGVVWYSFIFDGFAMLMLYMIWKILKNSGV